MQINTCILLLLILWLSLSLAITNQTNIPIAKPGCPTKCGNLSVPYPFGIGLGSNCSIGSWFDIKCNTSFNPPKAFIGTGNLEIINISDDRIQIKNWVAARCYNEFGVLNRENMIYVNVNSSPYSFSSENVLTVVGCDELSLVNVRNESKISTGCITQCSDSTDLTDGSCSGIGCCQTSIPRGLKYFTIAMNSLYNHTGVSHFNPCGYSFLGERSAYKFRTWDLLYSNFTNYILEKVPLVLDWAISNQNCTEARKSNDYACLQNSLCVDSDTGGGYWCRCSDGYEGNPYLSPGCTYVDECKSDPCHQSAFCTNFPGGYSCTCREGYIGDGTKDSILGCIPRHMNKPLVITALGSSIGLLLLLAVGFWLYKVMKKRNKHKRKQKFFKRNGGLLLQQQLTTDEGLIEKTRIFTAKELLKATDQFNQSRILGQGGQGTVYKGMLSDGRTVAVKKSKLIDENQLKQFINEVVILSQINHRNVVKLLGCCLETEVPLLVYEFIPNRTLSDHIHDESTEFPFTWKIRLRIATEVASALAYLHYETSPRIYHRDIKSGNILLDENYKAKVSDFGTSKSVAMDKTHITTLVKGTFGYLDPEYFQSNQFTDKSDVYSFGVVLVELFSGQKPISSHTDEDERSLATRFLASMRANSLRRIIDPKILEHDNEGEIVNVANLAYRCLNLDGKKRPTMKEVSMELENLRLSQKSHTTERNSQVTHSEIELAQLSKISSSTMLMDTNPLLHYTV